MELVSSLFICLYVAGGCGYETEEVIRRWIELQCLALPYVRKWKPFIYLFILKVSGSCSQFLCDFTVYKLVTLSC